MALSFQLKRLTQSDYQNYQGRIGEVTFDKDSGYLGSLRLHNGQTAGGNRLLNEELNTDVYLSHDNGSYKLLDRYGRTLLDDSGRYPKVLPVSRDNNNNYLDSEVLETALPPTPNGHDRYVVVLGKDEIGDGGGGLYRADTGDTAPPLEKTDTKIPIQGNANNGHWKFVPQQTGVFQISAVATIENLDITVAGGNNGGAVFFLPVQKQWFIPTQIDFLVKDEADGQQLSDAVYEFGRYKNNQFLPDQKFKILRTTFQKGAVYSYQFFSRKAYLAEDASLYLRVDHTNTGGKEVIANATLFGYYVKADGISPNPNLLSSASPYSDQLGDQVAKLLVGSGSISISYNDPNNTITIEAPDVPTDTDDIPEGSNKFVTQTQRDNLAMLLPEDTSPTTGKTLRFDGSWFVNQFLETNDISGLTNLASSADPDDLDLVSIDSPSTGEVWRFDGSEFVNAPLSTDDLTEGSNLFYTDSRVANLLIAGNGIDLSYDNIANQLMVSTSLHAVATSGDYNDLLNIPNLHTVATSGKYSDLVNTPTIAVEIQEAGTQTLTEAKTLNFGSDFSLTASGSTVDISLDISNASSTLSFGSDISSNISVSDSDLGHDFEVTDSVTISVPDTLSENGQVNLFNSHGNAIEVAPSGAMTLANTESVRTSEGYLQIRINSGSNRIYLEGADYEFLADNLPFTAAYSVRRLSRSQSVVMPTRRSSDNTEQTLNFDLLEAGKLNLENFVTDSGKNPGADGFLTKIPDQSGNDLLLTQTTASNQAKVVQSGTTVENQSETAVDFGGGNKYYTNNNFPYANKLSIFAWVEEGQPGERIFSCNGLSVHISSSNKIVAQLIADEVASWSKSGDVGNGPRGLAAYNNKLYASCDGSNDVYVFDGSSWSKSGDVGNSPRGLAAYNNKLYASCIGSNDVYKAEQGVVNITSTSKNNAIAAIDTGSSLKLFVGNGSEGFSTDHFISRQKTSSNIFGRGSFSFDGFTGYLKELLISNSDETANVDRILQNMNNYFGF